MSEKVRKKQPEIPQPKPDIILPKNDGTAAVDPASHMQFFSGAEMTQEDRPNA